MAASLPAFHQIPSTKYPLSFRFSICVLVIFVFVAIGGRAVAQDKPTTSKADSLPLSQIQMHAHVDMIFKIADALAKGRYNNAAVITEMNLGIGTLGGTRTGAVADMMDSQAMWEKGLAFRHAATAFADKARAVYKRKTSKNQAEAFDSFARMLNACQDCHVSERTR